MSVRINIGCGQTPTPGWRNYDNSWSVRIARAPALARVLGTTRLLSKSQLEFVDLARREGIRWADATNRIPEPDGSADVLYTSHMVEHLSREQALDFLAEARRVLRSGGVIRVAVPDIRLLVDRYLEDGDADGFIQRTLLTRAPPRSVLERFKYLATGDRNHQWMYDGSSLCALLADAGFQECHVAPAGTTRVSDCGQLDLKERAHESVFAEAMNP